MVIVNGRSVGRDGQQPWENMDHIEAITRIIWASKLDHELYNAFVAGLAAKCGCEFKGAPIKGENRIIIDAGCIWPLNTVVL